jgi:hypothetical protein
MSWSLAAKKMGFRRLPRALTGCGRDGPYWERIIVGTKGEQCSCPPVATLRSCRIFLAFATELPYNNQVQTVIETRAFLSSAKASGMTDAERLDVVLTVAANPMAGDLIVGSSGCRKVRIAGRGFGKSGGYRVVTFAAGDFGVFLLWTLSKGRIANLSQAQVNALATATKTITEAMAKKAV